MYYNRSYTYVLPMLDWWDNRFLINAQSRGCFIGDETIPDLDQNIFLLYRFNGEKWYTEYEEELRDNPHFVDCYEPDTNHTMFVYDVPEQHIENYKRFRESQYSKLDDDLKKKIITFHGKEKTRKIQAVMYRHESMYLEWEKKLNEGLPASMWTKIPRDMECTDSLHMNMEIFNDKILKDINTNKGLIKI